jgi:hypothetical protein
MFLEMGPLFSNLSMYKIPYNNIRCVKIVKVLKKVYILLVSDFFGVVDVSKMRSFFSLAT